MLSNMKINAGYILPVSAIQLRASGNRVTIISGPQDILLLENMARELQTAVARFKT
jgi:hypothetical protein